ncbi:MAG TPA: amidohydrolase family protein [Burkholderiaceae bacterium]|nr:amidohydrolase family protein [Burkholderiaceae bacterium]
MRRPTTPRSSPAPRPAAGPAPAVRCAVDAAARLVAALGLAIALGAPAAALRAAELPIFDAHVHYSHDAWASLPPKEAVALLRKAGLRRALVSSSSDDGTQRLHEEAPDLVVPSLRPYRSRGEIGTWVRDPTIVAHLESRLARYRYAAIGEFHVYGADADLPVMRRVVELAREHGLLLHLHGDADAVERVFRQDPGARVLWAHAGFASPDDVRRTLRRHRMLWADLAFRSDPAQAGKVAPEWREAFVEFPDRFMVGTDTFSPERWWYVTEHAAWARGWLADLPRDLAERIAWRNAESMLAARGRGTGGQ